MHDIIEHTKSQIKSAFHTSTRPTQPFRNRYEHTLRVLKWAERIQHHEGGDLNVITMAVLLHDVGWEEHIPHQEASFHYAQAYLQQFDVEHAVKAKICQAVLLHNQRHVPEHQLSLEEKVVMDADALDEIGLLSIVWDALGTACEHETYSYTTVFERIQQHQSGLYAHEEQFKTPTGLMLYHDRIHEYERALVNLEFELGYTESRLGDN